MEICFGRKIIKKMINKGNVSMYVRIFFMKIFTLFFFGVYAQQKEVKNKKKEITIAINPNLETFAIVERYANQYSKYLKGRYDLVNSQQSTRPLVQYAYDYFKEADNEKIARHMAMVIDTIISSKVGGQDQIFYALSYAKKFPQRGFDAAYKFHHTSLSYEVNEYITLHIKMLIEELRQYFIKNNVASFILKYQYFYEGAVNEVKNGISSNLLYTLEKYYRKNTDDTYTVYIVPSRAFSKGEWQANACKIPLKNNRFNNIQFLSSSYIDVKISSNGIYKKFGFADNEWLQDMVVHEFGHTFCEFNDSLKKHLEKPNTLFSGKWEKQMQPIGYYTWKDVVNEHIVRTGEIRIAEMTKNEETAKRLRESYINGKKFLFIPALEKKFEIYEKDNITYKTFQDFIPVAVELLNTFSIAERDSLLSMTEYKGMKRIYGYTLSEKEIIFQFELPEKFDINEMKSVSVAGSFNNWNPTAENYQLKFKENRMYELKIDINKIEKNKAQQFKFVVDATYWQNAPEYAQNVDEGASGNLILFINQ